MSKNTPLSVLQLRHSWRFYLTRPWLFVKDIYRIIIDIYIGEHATDGRIQTHGTSAIGS